MFWKREARREADNEQGRVQAELQALRRDNEALRAQLAQQQALAGDKEAECETLKAVLRHLGTFSETLAGSQQASDRWRCCSRKSVTRPSRRPRCR